MIKDGLWDAYGHKHMGNCGELCATKYQFSREAQDNYAVQSYTRSLKAQQGGWLRDEIVDVEVFGTSKPIRVQEDERPKRFDEAKLRQLPPAFEPDGTITAGNASGISDGAAATVVLTAEQARSLGVTSVARILGYTQKAVSPEWFTIAPIAAIRSLLGMLQLTPSRLDLYEINEAFAVVALAAIKELGLSMDQVNIHGGAVALGHPLGASGGRILTTLLHALKRTGGKRGIASCCIGGGEAVALAIELLPF